VCLTKGRTELNVGVLLPVMVNCYDVDAKSETDLKLREMMDGKSTTSRWVVVHLSVPTK